MKRSLPYIAVLIVLTFSAAAGQDREYTPLRTGTPPAIDAVFDDVCWEKAVFSGGFQMFTPYDDRPASFDTHFAVCYDDNNLYVAIRAFDPEPQKIVRRMTRRDNIEGDYAGIVIDSYYDRTTGFGFVVSASGVKLDMFLSKDGEYEDDDWNAVWWAATKIDTAGWSAEFRIPLSQLRFTAADEQVWGLQVGRYIFRKKEETYWNPMSQHSAGFIHNFGTLRGLYQVAAREVLDIVPYTVVKADIYEEEAGNPYRPGREFGGSAGLDAKIGLSNNFTMDLTVNPDFGQVEADPATVNLSAFETFFSERRPFFMEGSNITSAPLDVGGGNEQIFHSRRIGRRPQYEPELAEGEYADVPAAAGILGAAKISGRTRDGLSVGVLNAVTRREFADIYRDGSGTREAVEPLSNYTVAAVRQDLDEGNTRFGIIGTSVQRFIEEEQLDFLHRRAYSAGFDLRHYGKERIWQYDIRTYGSYVEGSCEAITRTQESAGHLFQRPDAPWVELDPTRTSLAGHGGSFRIAKVGGAFRGSVKLNWKSPGLELNDIGFMQNTDNISQSIWLSYRRTRPAGILRNFYINAFQWNNWNFGGIREYSGAHLSLNAQFTNFMSAETGTEYNGRRLSSTALRGGPRLRLPGSWEHWAWLGTDSRKDFYNDLFVFIRHSGDGRNAGHYLEWDMRWNISDHVSLTVSADWDRDREVFQYVTEITETPEPRYILARLHYESASLQIGLNLNITPDLSLQYRGRPFLSAGRYDDLKRVTDAGHPVYEERFSPLNAELTLRGDTYYCDEDLDGSVDYAFEDPDFEYHSFKSNLVLRWEYRPGSALYLVWSRDNSAGNGLNRLAPLENIRTLREEIPYNIFLLKLSYRLGR